MSSKKARITQIGVVGDGDPPLVMGWGFENGGEGIGLDCARNLIGGYTAEELRQFAEAVNTGN